MKLDQVKEWTTICRPDGESSAFKGQGINNYL